MKSQYHRAYELNKLRSKLTNCFFLSLHTAQQVFFPVCTRKYVCAQASITHSL